jgi:hypothetical protein
VIFVLALRCPHPLGSVRNSNVAQLCDWSESIKRFAPQHAPNIRAEYKGKAMPMARPANLLSKSWTRRKIKYSAQFYGHSGANRERAQVERKVNLVLIFCAAPTQMLVYITPRNRCLDRAQALNRPVSEVQTGNLMRFSFCAGYFDNHLAIRSNTNPE